MATAQLCLVCGAPALGGRYSVLSCTSCDSFFYGNAGEENAPACLLAGDCKTDFPFRRSCCPNCRLRKCWEVGMVAKPVVVPSTRVVNFATTRVNVAHAHQGQRRQRQPASTSQMAVQRPKAVRPPNFKENVVQEVWEKAEPILDEDPALWRRDRCGYVMKRTARGCMGGEYGWTVDHIVPISKGGTHELENLQPLNWKANAAKKDKLNWHYPDCLVIDRQRQIRLQRLKRLG